MRAIRDSPVGLLVVTGGLLGACLPLGKLATAAGVAPVAWSLLISCGAGTILLAAILASGRGFRLDAHRLRYFAILGTVSYAVPNLLLFAAIPHLGAGFAGIMFTLSPLMTLAFSLALRVSRPTPLGIAGIAVGFVGALMVAATRGEIGQPASLFWIGIGLAIPLMLAIGNIYRTLDWPPGSAPLELAAGSNLGAAVLLLAAGLFVPALGFDPAAIARVPVPAVAQVAASAAMFAFFFRLQAVGGPVYLSQIGYVAAAVGLASGTVLLGERYGLLTWLGAAVVVAGIAMTTKAQVAQTRE